MWGKEGEGQKEEKWEGNREREKGGGRGGGVRNELRGGKREELCHVEVLVYLVSLFF